MERNAAKAAIMSDFCHCISLLVGSGKLTAGIHVTITIVLYFGVKLQVLFDNNMGTVSIEPVTSNQFGIDTDLCIS